MSAHTHTHTQLGAAAAVGALKIPRFDVIHKKKTRKLRHGTAPLCAKCFRVHASLLMDIIIICRRLETEPEPGTGGFHSYAAVVTAACP